MKIVKILKKHKTLILRISLSGLLVLAFALIIVLGRHYFHAGARDDIVRDEFLDKFKAFYGALLHYIHQPAVVLGFCAALVLYVWILYRLFYKYFNMFKPGMILDIGLNPKALESIPHSLLVLSIFYAFLRYPDHLRLIMLLSFVLISIPFIYKILEDAFITANKEGIVENYLVLPISNWKIVRSFLKQKFTQVVVIPFVFLVILMVYWEFLYSSIGITGDEKSAPGVFYNNYNDSYLMNYPEPHNYLILLQVGLFAIAIILFLYMVYKMIGTGAKHIIPTDEGKALEANDPGETSLQGDILVSCKHLTITAAGKTDRHHSQTNQQNQPDNTPTNMILQDITLEINKGENICIMGESGSGKTTLVREIAGIPSRGLKRQKGTIQRKRNDIFSIFQDVDLYLDPYQTLYYYVKKAFKKRHQNIKTSPKPTKIDKRLLIRCIAEVGLLKPLLEDRDNQQEKEIGSQQINQALQTNNHQEIENIAQLLLNGLKTKTKQKLSGGEKQKFYLLIALILKPDILIADEIFTDVDRTSSDKIVDLLFKKDFTVVFISHDIGMVKELVDNGWIQKVYYLKDQKLHPDTWVYSREKPGTEASMPQWALEMWQAFKNIRSEKMSGVDVRNDSAVVFKIGNVTREFEDGRKVKFVNENGTLTLRKGVNYALVGENGTGKTTLFKILTKLSNYKKGKITFRDGKHNELRKKARYECARQNQLVFQKTGNAIVEKVTIENYLLSFFKKNQHQQCRIKIQQLMAEFFSEEKAQQVLQRQFKELSVGEQRRVLLIRALLLVDPTGILFVDEAMRGMDVFLKERLIYYLKKEKLQLLLISHDPHLVDALCEKKIRLTFDKKTGNTIVKATVENPGVPSRDFAAKER